MKNTIAEHIADFIKHFHPFSEISYEKLLYVTNNCKVIYLEKNEYLFKINNTVHDSFYVVASGAIGLSITSDTDDILIDKCDEGDIIGLRPFFAKDNYLVTAKAREETILYAIPIEIFKSVALENTKVLDFLLQSFASNTRNPYDKQYKGKLISENIIYDDRNYEIQYYQPVNYTNTPITASPSDIVKYVAQTMSSKNVGSILIQENKKPIGIITDRDLRSKVATGLYDINTTLDKIMSYPVITVAENLSIAEAQMMMLKYNVGHLCVTKDGSNQSEISGIISEHDIVVAQANNPSVLLKQIKKAEKTSDLKVIRNKITILIQNAIDKNIPINQICFIIGELNIALSKRVIQLAIQKMDTPPPSQFAWLNIGSQARKEQLLVTNFDAILVFEDVENALYQKTKDYFNTLAGIITKKMAKIGYILHPESIMASSSNWCKPITDWNNQFKAWINKPNEYNTLKGPIIFDYDFIYGDENLIIPLTENIFNELKNNDLFFAYLGSNALNNPPPLGFFKQFLVESDGEYKDTFNIKSRALTPLIDATRILSLHLGIKNNPNTSFRLTKLAEYEPKNAAIYEACNDAFLELLKFRTENGLQNNSDGIYLNLNELSKLDKVKLKNTFQPISDIQEIIKNRFKLTYFT